MPKDVEQMLKPLHQKDLRIQCRLRGLSPAGSRETLAERLKDHMLATRDFALKSEDGSDINAQPVVAGLATDDISQGMACNNYSRPAGQNVGNFLTDRPSSRVLAAPGGKSSISFGDYEPSSPKIGTVPYSPQGVASIGMAPGLAPIGGSTGMNNNNYARPAGQNVGNFITDRSSSRVLAPPGGASTIQFG